MGCSGLRCAVLGCTGLYWAELGCTGLYWTVLVFTRLNWAVVGCSRLNCGVLGCTGRSQQLFVCVFSHFRHGDKRPNEQPGEPRASLLLTSVRRQSFAKRSYEQTIQVLKLGASFARNWIKDTFVMKSCGFVNTIGQGQFVSIFVDEVCKLFGASSSWLATCTFCPSARGLRWRFGEVEVETEMDTSATQNEYGNWVSFHCLAIAYKEFIWL